MKLLAAILAITLAAQAGIVADRYPDALVKVTATGRLITSEGAWKGHVKRVKDVPERKGVAMYLLEPISEWRRRYVPALVPSTNLFVHTVILDGQTNRGAWLSGRKVVP